jgi:hypothetical protein
MLPLITYLLISLSNPTGQAVLGSLNVVLASHSISLEERYNDSFVNGVFRDNILLTLAYLNGSVKSKTDISWGEVEAPFHYEFTLRPGEEFAFHNQILPQYKGNVVKTTNAHFNWQDGFKSDGYLTGDGVCHLASLIYWVAKDAGLDAVALTNHNFAKINEVPKEYGVAIYDWPGQFETSARQNLYITNSFDKPVTFIFHYDGDSLTVSIAKEG